MKKLLIISCVFAVSLSIRSSAVEYGVKFNQAYLYSDYVYSNSPELGVMFTENQNRINKIIYGQANVIFSKDHFDTCYSDVDTPIFNTFREHTTALLPMSFSVVEWGGNGDLRYSFTPAIATKKLIDIGVPLSSVEPTCIDSNYYESMGISFNDKSYWGPLQINKNYMTPTHNKGYKCGYVPTDYYSWPDACQWTFHDKCEQIKNCWNKEYTFINEYAVVAHTAIAHNSGGSHLSSKNFYLDTDWYPWKSSNAVFNYVDYITNDQNLQIIFLDADNYASKLLSDYTAKTEKGSLYKSISDCKSMSGKMNIDWSLFVKDKWLSNMSNGVMSGSGLRNWEKTMYPIQAIWSYRVLEKLYGLK